MGIILEIIERHCQLSSKTVTKQAAEEIVEIIEQFLEWTHTGDHIHLYCNSQGFDAGSINEWWIKDLYSPGSHTKKSFDEIFELWCESKKQLNK